MCKFIEKSNERILLKRSKSEILRCIQSFMLPWKLRKCQILPCQLKSFIGIFFSCKVSACELQPCSFHNLANAKYLQNVKTVFSHLTNLIKIGHFNTQKYKHLFSQGKSSRLQLKSCPRSWCCRSIVSLVFCVALWNILIHIKDFHTYYIQYGR